MKKVRVMDDDLLENEKAKRLVSYVLKKTYVDFRAWEAIHHKITTQTCSIRVIAISISWITIRHL